MTPYKLRDYQQEASDRAVAFFKDSRIRYNAIEVLPTGSGKSLVIADIASRLDGHTIVFQPSKEILQQNFAKMCSYGVLDCSVYSASLNTKDINRITFATIGSVMNHMDDFMHFDNIIIDECHLVSANGGQYEKFISTAKRKVLGLTATPYRLSSNSFGSMLKFLTRSRPRIFAKVIYHVQIDTLLRMGFLAELDYYYTPAPHYEEGRLISNSTGADYTDKSVINEYERVNFYSWLVNITRRVMSPKNGRKRNGILVFTRFLKEAERLASEIEGCAMVSGDTPTNERKEILENFKAGRIRVVVNVGVLTTGFDYPELDTIIMARPTKSLSLWYQICVDSDTEILTKRGWCSCDKIQCNDIVAAYKNGEVIWSKIQNITQRKVYKGEVMVSAGNSYLNLRVTGEHDLLVRAHGASCNFYKQKAIEVATRRRGLIEIPVSGIENSAGCILSDDEIRFIGWVISDGSVSKSNNAIHIVQSKVNNKNIEEIERVLKSCRIRYCKVLARRKGEYAKYSDTYHFNISYGKPRKKKEREMGLTGWQKYEAYIKGCKVWPESFEEFNCHQFDILVETLDKADGAHTKAIDYIKHTKSICCGISEEYCDKLQSLAVRRGWRACKTVSRKGRKNAVYILRMLKTDKATISGKSYDLDHNRTRLVIDSPHEDQIVWCVKNEVGTIITRRKGKVVIMGNCGRAIRPSPKKDKGWIVDLCGSLKRFGKVEDLRLVETKPNLWQVQSKGRQLTNIILK